MKNNTVKNLVNQVKKALTTKSSLPEMISNSAYIDANGAIIAHDFNTRHNTPDHDIVVFIAGIVEDVAKREKLYSKDALTLAANTGIFNGGKELPEAYADYYKTPAEDFSYITTIPADDLKAAAYCVSDNTARPVLTNIHINTKELYIEAVDGFRAYRKRLVKAVDVEALTPFERDNGLLIPGRAAAYNFKNEIAVYTSEKYIKLISDDGMTLFIRKPDAGQFVNLSSIYEGRGSYKRMNNDIHARIIDIKGFTSALKAAAGAKDDHGHYTIALRTRKGFIDYYIEALDLFGSIEAETEATPAGFNNLFNARYLYDAIANQECSTLEISDSATAPVYITGKGEACALVLPIRGGSDFDRFANYKPEAAAEAKPEAKPEAPAKDNYFRVSDNLTTGMTDEEKEALKRLNARQHAENRFTNIDAEDIRAEVERMRAEKAAQEQEAPAPDPETAAEATEEAPEAAPETTAEISEQVTEKLEIVKREEITPEIREARELYRRLKKCGFTPNEYQEADALIIYKNNKELLKPLARAAGGLYIDTLSIIAAIMTIGDKLN